MHSAVRKAIADNDGLGVPSVGTGTLAGLCIGSRCVGQHGRGANWSM
jgi:hypothetical protein